MGKDKDSETALDAADDATLQAALARLADWQFDGADNPSGAAKPFDLGRFDPDQRPFSCGDKSHDKDVVAALALDIDALQNKFYADRRFKLLIVLQGTDTSGKDGTVRGVFSQTSPLGVQTIGWKAPSDRERAHDYLWRIHQRVPGDGEVMVFNRSHYEDVLVPRVEGWVTVEQTRQRYAHIRDFERMLTETGTVICKFLLHISKEEQRDRLQARLDNPAKHWKFELGDLNARKKWDAYQHAYSDAIAATGTSWAPWTIVPADSKTHRNLMVASVIRQRLSALGLRFPPGDPALEHIKVE
ncbi:PPK2 family polyphosphate kinase [Piscinibacter sakaiensis]|uniref:PPK2 family polyphosphate kinase n=1 Tax=Piscinibacter sakaiensis TaxID=1547922 RepID=UPI003AB0BEDC